MKKIKMLVIPSDTQGGVGKFRSIDPHVYIGEHYKDEFDIDIVTQIPNTNLEQFFRQYDLIQIHKQLDRDGKCMDLIKFLGIPIIVDIDDHYILGQDHPMYLSAKQENWSSIVLNHLKKADYVTTTTEIFAKLLRKTNPNVAVFPNAVDPTEPQFAIPKTQKGDKLRVGIICGSTHWKDIELLGNITRQINKDKVQFVLCGFDTRGTRTIFDGNGGKTTRPIKPEETVWCEYEKVFTDNYKDISQAHKDFLMKYISNTDDPFINESYRRMWTRNIKSYATHYANVDVLIAPLKENDFNKVKSELKEIECGFTHTAFIGQDFGPYTLNLTNLIEKGGSINENGTALLVPSTKNHKLWAKYINKLASDDEMLKKLQDNLYNFVKDKYSLETVCKARVELYKKLANKE
jgi:glycosyltransferase involved in cell wall biosynthesis